MPKKRKRKKDYSKAYLSIFLVFSVTFCFIIFYQINKTTKSSKESVSVYENDYNNHQLDTEIALAVKAAEAPVPVEVKIKHIATPKIVKGIYLTAYSAGGLNLSKYIDLINSTEINSIVIDIKNQKGSLAFNTENESLIPYVDPKYIPIENLDDVLEKLGKEDIYRIARIPVFQDPFYADKHPEYTVKTPNGSIWLDYKGTPWLSPTLEAVWAYNAEIGLEAYNRGFDEIQFDYIRFPSDGHVARIDYAFPADGPQTKTEIMRKGYKFLDKTLRSKGIPISIDLFGLTFWMTDFDLNIGQLLKDAIPYFDYISPMVYPSHYPEGYFGFSNPAEHPYEIIFRNLEKGKTVYEEWGFEFTARPWIQDFNMGAIYDGPMVRKQMKAVYDSGAQGWILWNAANRYTDEALLPAEKVEEVEEEVVEVE